LAGAPVDRTAGVSACHRRPGVPYQRHWSVQRSGALIAGRARRRFV